MVGKLFIARIYFTNMSDYKIRPILAIKEYLDNDLLYLPLTTNLDTTGILLDNSDIEIGYLKEPSVIAIPKIGILHKSLILKEIAKLKQVVLSQIMEKICQDFNCNGL